MPHLPKASLTRRATIGYGTALATVAATGMARAAGVVTVYSADGLKDGKPNWFDTVFTAFTKKTGIAVNYIEGGSGVVVNRVLAERANPQADILVTLPPFMQQAAAKGVLAPMRPAALTAIPAATRSAHDLWFPLVNNYACWIYNTKRLTAPPAHYADLLSAKFKNRLQYSTPGQAGDGTAVMLEAIHVMGGADQGFGYLHKLQTNNLGPSSSTGRLAGLVDKSEILVANGDVQMNFAQMRQYPNIGIFFPAGANGRRISMPLPYDVALVKNAPHGGNGAKLIDFMLSREAQDSVYDIARGFPVRSDVPATGKTATALKEIMQGVDIWVPHWAKVLASLDANIARWHQVTAS
ncbi:MAG TPA: 2-aminoethylphosphonate ABC transporter substrate-binding protein [Acidiphilium sp.]|nr:MAG: 2-aminoethylphosphonate ABC transporter substrate-binding protein [Acidiphilium sp. 21-60-14]OYV92141.1 MAG: 2-aminoethylphosphonate ABC transporter substrate-binding protein [Acidiphilium sp. 37-60-79]OZB40220.1 MAG: 2-aminoethylphosphonate ABC transporter substrate-binding protein [Acidiphilium sp. 34-60-192]HQT89281.1 2-aminoethylphosphonate ABC transporter substrate-binding protein [Acidiphilium sp.]HQU24577.1 2-aminoethylphosphonate ABC transporter substrate-binding protein [Acidip